MTDALKQARDALKPLPEPAGVGMLIDYRWEGAPSLDPRAAHPHVSVSVPAYTADQMREYARAAIARADAAPRDDGMPASADERHLRRLLAIRVGMPHTYTDDGEANGQQHDIAIDFMREPVADIDAKLRALNVARAECADAAQAAPVAPELDVRRILLDVVPGDGNGLEIYAETVADVETKLSSLWDRIEELSRLAASPPAPAAQEPAPIEPLFRRDWDWRHPAAQFYIGQNARKSIYLQLAEQIVDGDDDAYSDDYWLPLHDKLTTAMRRLRELEAAQQEPAQADARDAARLDWMAQHEARIGWNREGDACRVWVRSDDPSDPDPVPVCGWAKTFDNPRAAIDAAIDAAQAMPAGGA